MGTYVSKEVSEVRMAIVSIEVSLEVSREVRREVSIAAALSSAREEVA